MLIYREGKINQRLVATTGDNELVEQKWVTLDNGTTFGSRAGYWLWVRNCISRTTCEATGMNTR